MGMPRKGVQGKTCGREGEHASRSVIPLPASSPGVVGAMACLPELSGLAASEGGCAPFLMRPQAGKENGTQRHNLVRDQHTDNGCMLLVVNHRAYKPRGVPLL